MNFPVPVVCGVIVRRLLVNFRVQPDALARLLPAPFRPKLVNGFGLAGICLIRLEQVRPRGFPAFVGLSSENAAHRIAVEWTEGGKLCGGVFIPRRDTDAWLNRVLGGRIFPGWHQAADFQVDDDGERVRLEVCSRERAMTVSVTGRATTALPPGSVFRTLDAASEFFRAGAVGWSVASRPGCCEGLELCSEAWSVAPFEVESVSSSFFADTQSFPPGSVEFDCALVMRNLPHEWHARGRMQVREDQP